MIFKYVFEKWVSFICDKTLYTIYTPSSSSSGLIFLISASLQHLYVVVIGLDLELKANSRLSVNNLETLGEIFKVPSMSEIR